MDAIAGALLRWYDENRRTMPWRDVGNPWATWVSEIMLQQTRVETVRGYYDRFMARFPTPAALAEAEEGDVLKLWEGLGYYSRARNLQRGARQVMAEYGGEIPRDPAELRRVAGIGPYTAGAIASIAYGQPVPAVDGNVIRVITRLRGIRENAGSPAVRQRIEAETTALIPPERPGDFNQALMDLGAGICVPGTPDCDRCPLAASCDAREAGDADGLPLLPQKTPPREERYDLLILRRGDAVLLRQRTERMLQGLWIFPMVPEQENAASREREAAWMGLRAANLTEAGEARHVFTHRVWVMHLWQGELLADAPEGWMLADAEALRSLPMPTAVKAARQAALQLLGTSVPPMSK